jgi:Na+-driven multidrug efflux pump
MHYWVTLLVMVAVNVINISVAWSLTQGVAGLPRLGVMGSGLGAASGQTIDGLIVLALLVRGRGGLRGAGDTRATLAITLLSVWGVRVVVTYVLGETLGLALIGAWIAIGVDFALRAALFWWRFRSGKWQSIRV